MLLAASHRQNWAVVQVVAEDLTSKAAAEHLYLSVSTVNTRLRHAFAKLGVRSRVEVTRIVLAHLSLPA